MLCAPSLHLYNGNSPTYLVTLPGHLYRVRHVKSCLTSTVCQSPPGVPKPARMRTPCTRLPVKKTSWESSFKGYLIVINYVSKKSGMNKKRKNYIPVNLSTRVPVCSKLAWPRTSSKVNLCFIEITM